MTRRHANMAIEEAALSVVRRLRDASYEALFAGGCVRDMLLGIEPTDIDVATNAVPERVVELFRKTRQVGMQFGVVLVKSGPHWIEVATFRSDINYADGRRPERVEFTSAKEDAQRRDFTINGLFYDPVAQQVIDYVDGQQDLQAGVIRAIGEPAHRFAEDHLRMLRAVRFATRFGFAIEPTTAVAIREHANQLPRISAERIREELEKMFVRASRAESLKQIADLNLLPYLWPGTTWEPASFDRSIRAMATLKADADFVLSLAAMLHSTMPHPHAFKEARRVGHCLRCSNDEISDLTWLVRHIDSIEHVETLRLPEFKRLLAHERFDNLLELHRVACVADARPLTANVAAQQRREAIPPEQVAPPPWVTGEDLIAMGLTPGPMFGKVLNQLYDEQLNNQLTSRDSALERVRAIIATRP